MQDATRQRLRFRECEASEEDKEEEAGTSVPVFSRSVSAVGITTVKEVFEVSEWLENELKNDESAK